MSPLISIELDDERFLNGRVDLGTLRILEDLPRQPIVIGLEPGRDGGGEVGRVADDLLGGRAGLHRDDVVGLDLVARDVDPAPVDVEVAVADELARLRAGCGEAEPIHNVVEASLEHPQQRLAGDAGALARLGVVVAELLLEQAVEAARLLLLAELHQILALLDAPTAVLARRIAAALDRALLGQATLALEEELHPLAAADPALRA